MKKILFTALFACLTMVSFGQEKPKESKAHVCTETCDHSEQKVVKDCCKAALAEGKSCDKCETPAPVKKVAAKSCCSESAAGSKSCGDSKPAKKAKMAKAEKGAKGSCCSEGTKKECGSATK